MRSKEKHSETTKSIGSRFVDAPIGKKILMAAGCLIAVVLAAAVITVAVTAIKVGRINEDSLYANIERSSVLYDMNGTEIDTLHYTEDRTIVPIEEMPDNLKNAFIAVEDKTFYQHHGFNFRRMLGAVLSKLLGRSSSISGTSTITQQLARNAYLPEIKSQRSLRRKLSEMYIAWRLERNLSKDQILEAYLNTIYLGYGNYGVGAAARTYFSKDVKDLTLAECAALAALPQAPDAYALITEESEGNEEIRTVSYYSLDSMDDEDGGSSGASDTGSSSQSEESDDEESGGTGLYANDISKDRRNLVLELMVEQGYISSDEAAAADVDIIDILKPSFEKNESAYMYFTDYVAGVVTEDLMEKYSMSEEEAQRMVYTGGLKIHTTLNSDIQNTIYEEFQNDSNFPSAVDGSEVQASMVVTEVGTGEVRALVGGRDSEGSKLFNRALSPRQPGSSVKPLAVYGAALQKSLEYAEKNQTFPLTDYGFDKQGTKYWGDYITASSVVVDEALTINGEEWPQNFSKSYSGRQSLRTALQQSINTCAVKILWQVGLDYSADMLTKYGLTTLETDTSQQTNDVNPAALALGAMTYGVTPLEMSLAYAAFPGGGSVNTAVCYTEVTDSSGKSLLKGESEKTQVIDEGVAWIMTDILKTVVSRGIAGSAAISGVEVGGKTGTTNDTFDVWFDGFTPQYSAALWIGTDMNVEMNGSSSQAAALWSRIMRQVSGIKSGEYRDMPSNVIKQNGEYYTEGTEKNAGKYTGESSNSKKDEDEDDDEDSWDITTDTDSSTDTGSTTTGSTTTDTSGSSGSSSGSSGSGSSGSSSGSGSSDSSGSSGSSDSGSSGGSSDSGSGSDSGGSSDSGGGSSDSGSDSGGSESGSDSGGGSEQTDDSGGESLE